MNGNLIIRPLRFDIENQAINILDTNKYFIRVKVDDLPVIDSLIEYIPSSSNIFKEISGIRLQGTE
jgi:hypothetical protein